MHKKTDVTWKTSCKKPFSLSCHHLIDRAVCCSSNLKVLIFYPWTYYHFRAKILSVLHRPCTIMLVCTWVNSSWTIVRYGEYAGESVLCRRLKLQKGLLTGAKEGQKKFKTANLAWSATGRGEDHCYQVSRLEGTWNQLEFLEWAWVIWTKSQSMQILLYSKLLKFNGYFMEDSLWAMPNKSININI